MEERTGSILLEETIEKENVKEVVLESETTKNGIIESDGFKFWHKAEVVYLHVKKHLRSIFPDSLILQEFNKIDLTVLDEEIPVEIQSTIIGSDKCTRHSNFENAIRKQIEDNIENYGKCWFFFDAEYYRYLNEAASLSNISINFDWFAKYVQEDKLRVFTVRYSGEIKELKYEDLGFIKKLSNTCKVEHNDDNRILNRNKIKIITNVLYGNKFTQNEIDSYVSEYDNNEHENVEFSLFLRKSKVERKKLYGYILKTLGDLDSINKFLDMNDENPKDIRTTCSHLGILELYGPAGVSARSVFIDKFNICQYFPGYLRTKDEWNRTKGGHYTASQLRELFMTYNLRMSGKQGKLFDY